MNPLSPAEARMKREETMSCRETSLASAACARHLSPVPFKFSELQRSYQCSFVRAASRRCPSEGLHAGSQSGQEGGRNLHAVLSLAEGAKGQLHAVIAVQNQPGKDGPQTVLGAPRPPGHIVNRAGGGAFHVVVRLVG